MTTIVYINVRRQDRYLGSIRTIPIRIEVEIIRKASKARYEQLDCRALAQGHELDSA